MTFLSQCTKCSLATVSKLLWELFNGFIDRIDWKMTGNEVTWSKWPQVGLESWGQNQLCFRGIPIEHHFSQHTTGTHNFIIPVRHELWPSCFSNRTLDDFLHTQSRKSLQSLLFLYHDTMTYVMYLTLSRQSILGKKSQKSTLACTLQNVTRCNQTSWWRFTY